MHRCINIVLILVLFMDSTQFSKCSKHPKAGVHFGQETQVWRCNYCNREV